MTRKIFRRRIISPEVLQVFPSKLHCLPLSEYSCNMSANELLERVKALPSREQRKFFEGVHALEESVTFRPQRAGRNQSDGPTLPPGGARFLGAKCYRI